jgi:TolB-like protein
MRKLVFVIFVSLTFLLSYSAVSMAYENEIKSLSTAMADNIAKAGKKRIAVVDFTDLQGNITELGRFIAEEISADFTMTAKGFEVIDRNHLSRILAEHKLSVSGIVDQKTVQKLGQIAGVDAIVTGSITPLENSVRVVCKIIATDTARIIGAAKGDIAKTRAIGELLGKGIGTGVGSTSPQTTQQAKINAEGFIFEAKVCKLIGGKIVECYVSITNTKGEERKLSIGAGGGGHSCSENSYAYDDKGIQYLAKNVRIGASKGSWVSMDQVFPPNLPIIVILKFEGVLPESKNVTLRLGLNGFLADKRRECVSFFPLLRNIPLTR